MIISLIVIYVNKLQKSTFNFPSSILNPSSVSIHKQQSTLILSLIQVCIMSCIICPFLQLQMCKGWFIDLCKILVNVCVLSLSFQKFIMVASSVVTIIVVRVWKQIIIHIYLLSIKSQCWLVLAGSSGSSISIGGVFTVVVLVTAHIS